MSGNFIYRYHVEPRVKLYSPREESFPIPLKYIDVSRTTHTNLHVKQEKRIDDSLEYRWVTRLVFILGEKPPEEYMWSGKRSTRKQLTSRPDHLWPELWRGMSKNAKLREKHKWTIEIPKLDNASRSRGIYFIDLEDNNRVSQKDRKSSFVRNNTESAHVLNVFSIGIKELSLCICGQFLVEANPEESFITSDWMLYPALRDQERTLSWCSTR